MLTTNDESLLLDMFRDLETNEIVVFGDEAKCDFIFNSIKSDKWINSSDKNAPPPDFYNPQGSITARKCSNPKCPYMMAEKVVGVAELLGIKGIGSKTAFNIVSSNGLQSHFEAIPFITREKPVVTLYTFLRMAFINICLTSIKQNFSLANSL